MTARERLISLLLEVSVEDLKKQWVDSGKMDPRQFDIIVKTAQNKSSWVTWFGKKVLDGQISLKEEDIEKWQKVIKIFERYKQRFSVKDIFQIKTKDQISKFVQQALDIESEMINKDKATKAAKDKYAEFYKGTVDLDGKTFKVYVLPKGDKDNYKISRALAGDTHWCTAASSPGYFDDYISKGSLIMFFNVADSKDKYQLHVERNQFMNRADNQIPWSSGFAEEACKWAVKKGIASDIPKGLKVELEFRNGLPPKEDAPKLSSFKVFEKDGISIYYAENFNLKQHYWAFNFLNVRENRNELIGSSVLAFTSSDKEVTYVKEQGEDWDPLSYRDNWVNLGKSEAVYEAFVFADKKYGLKVPSRLALMYDKSIPDVSTFITVPAVGGDSSVSIYDIKETSNKNLKLAAFLGESIESWTSEEGRRIYCAPSPEAGEGDKHIVVYPYVYGSIGDWRINCIHSVAFSPKVQEAFAEYLTTKVFRETSTVGHVYGIQNLSHLISKLVDYFCKGTEQPDQEGFTNVKVLKNKPTAKSVANLTMERWPSVTDEKVVMATIPGTKRTIMVGNSTLLVSGWRYNTAAIAKSLGERKTQAARKLAASYGITCKYIEEGIKKYFPNLIDNEEEREQSKKISAALRPLDLLRTRDWDREYVDIPLYRSRSGRTIRLQENALKMSFKDFYPSLYKISPEYAKKVRGLVSDSATVYLYKNGDTWNCAIIEKDQEGRTTKIIRRRGYGMGVTWDFSQANWDEDEIDARQVNSLHEAFDPEQRARLMELAGIGE